MRQFTYTITDPVGLHARPAGLLAREAAAFEGVTVTVHKGGASARATQILRLMSLGVRAGDEVTVQAEGPREAEAIAALEAFFRAHL